MTAIPLIAGIALLSLAALHDTAFRTVPNSVSAGLLVCGLALRGMDGELLGAAIAAVLVFTAAATCWRFRLMGGADVKLLGTAALLVPPLHVPAMLVTIALAGGVLTLPYLLARRRLAMPGPGRPGPMLARIARIERRRLRQGGPLPYAVAIAAGVGIAIAQGGV